MANFRYDPAAGAAYLRFSGAAIVESEGVSPGLVLDFDQGGRIVALAVPGAAARLASDALVAAE